MSDMRVNLCGVELKIQVIAASGTFGYGMEYNEFFPISKLGGISCNGRPTSCGDQLARACREAYEASK